MWGPRPQKEAPEVEKGGLCGLGWSGRRAAGADQAPALCSIGNACTSCQCLPAPRLLPLPLPAGLVLKLLELSLWMRPEVGFRDGHSLGVCGWGSQESVPVMSSGHLVWSLQEHDPCMPSSGRGMWGCWHGSWKVVFLGQALLLVFRPRCQGNGAEAFSELSSAHSPHPNPNTRGAKRCCCLMSERRLLGYSGTAI